MSRSLECLPDSNIFITGGLSSLISLRRLFLPHQLQGAFPPSSASGGLSFLISLRPLFVRRQPVVSSEYKQIIEQYSRMQQHLAIATSAAGAGKSVVAYPEFCPKAAG